MVLLGSVRDLTVTSNHLQWLQVPGTGSSVFVCAPRIICSDFITSLRCLADSFVQVAFDSTHAFWFHANTDCFRDALRSRAEKAFKKYWVFALSRLDLIWKKPPKLRKRELRFTLEIAGPHIAFFHVGDHNSDVQLFQCAEIQLCSWCLSAAAGERLSTEGPWGTGVSWLAAQGHLQTPEKWLSRC